VLMIKRKFGQSFTLIENGEIIAKITLKRCENRNDVHVCISADAKIKVLRSELVGKQEEEFNFNKKFLMDD